MALVSKNRCYGVLIALIRPGLEALERTLMLI